MNWTMKNASAGVVAATLAGVLLSLPQAALSQSPPSSANASAQADNTADSSAAARLDKKQYRDVKVSVDNAIATLTGTVNLYVDKADAEKRVHKAKGVTAVRNLIQVAGPDVPDSVLWSKLGEKLEYDRVFYGNAFNAISIRVQNGVVTLGGHALSYNSRNSALDLVSYYPGVKDVVDEMQVDPVSIFDDRIRMQVYRAVYGYPTFQRYSIDPVKPIRISVQNGHVELYGMVDSQTDKDIAFLRANGVPGVFEVKNYLQVAEQQAKKQK